MCEASRDGELGTIALLVQFQQASCSEIEWGQALRSFSCQSARTSSRSLPKSSLNLLNASFVLEAKDRKLSLSKTLQELDAALANHGALAAVAVFSSQEVAPMTVPFQWWGNKAIVIVDKDDTDPGAMHLAYVWARWVARRSISADAETEVDLGRVEAALTAARRALARHQSVKACHSAAKKKIEEGAIHVADLVDEVDEALKVLWDELNR